MDFDLVILQHVEVFVVVLCFLLSCLNKSTFLGNLATLYVHGSRQHKGGGPGVMVNVREPIIFKHCKTMRLDPPPPPTKPPLLPNFIVSVLIMCLIFEIWQ